jgi:hypothetical protein
MGTEFKRTQVGSSFFLQLLIVGAIAGPFVYFVADGNPYLLWSVAGVMLLFALLFYSLTITVSGGRVGYSFGPGIIKGSYGFHAVEITLKNGKKVRLGTDRPEELKAAIERETQSKLRPVDRAG